jgi:hypothetical protein
LFIFGLCFILILALATPLALADEGMWLYNAFPKDRVQKQYGFLPTQEWLDHLQLSSVRFNNGGSGSFVSPTAWHSPIITWAPTASGNSPPPAMTT